MYHAPSPAIDEAKHEAVHLDAGKPEKHEGKNQAHTCMRMEDRLAAMGPTVRARNRPSARSHSAACSDARPACRTATKLLCHVYTGLSSSPRMGTAGCGWERFRGWLGVAVRL